MMQRFPCRITAQIVTEQLHTAVRRVSQRHISGNVLGQDQILRFPQRIFRRQRFRHYHVQRSAADSVLRQRLPQRILVYGAASSDVDDDTVLRQQ